MPEWYLVLGLLSWLALLGLAWSPLLALGLPLLLLGGGWTIARCVAGARAATFPGGPMSRFERIRRRSLVGLLHFLQPLARLKGRLAEGLVPWRPRVRARAFLWPRVRRLRFWRWVDESAPRTLSRMEAYLNEQGSVVRRGGGWDDWELEVGGGAFGFARLRHCMEWYGERRQLFRVAVVPGINGAAAVASVAAVLLAVWAWSDGAWGVGVLLGLVGLLVVARAAWESGASSWTLVAGARAVVEEGVELGREGVEPTGEGPEATGVGVEPGGAAGDDRPERTDDPAVRMPPGRAASEEAAGLRASA